MRALAQFVMRGPLQAGGVAAVATAIPLLFWIGAAVVGLVVLRLGISRGLGVGLWALLPALGWSWVAQDPSALVVLIQVFLMTSIIRTTLSWERALLGASALAIAIGLALPLLYPELVDELVRVGVSFYEQYNAEVARQLGPQLEPVIRNTMNASLAGTLLVCSVAVTMLSRSWQATLYNPGGFRREFHDFRLSRWSAALCGVLIILAPVTGFNPVLLAWSAGLPLFIAAVALVHGFVGRKGKGIHWLVVFYTALVLLGPSLLLLLLVVAFVDSWLDIRGRIKPPGPVE